MVQSAPQSDCVLTRRAGAVYDLTQQNVLTPDPKVAKSSEIGLPVGNTPVGLPKMMASLWADHTMKSGTVG